MSTHNITNQLYPGSLIIDIHDFSICFIISIDSNKDQVFNIEIGPNQGNRAYINWSSFNYINRFYQFVEGIY